MGLTIFFIIAWSVLSSFVNIHYFEENGEDEFLFPFFINTIFGPVICLIYFFEFIFKSIKKNKKYKSTLEDELEHYENIKNKIENTYKGKLLEIPREPTLEPQFIKDRSFTPLSFVKFGREFSWEFDENNRILARKRAGEILKYNLEDESIGSLFG